MSATSETLMTQRGWNKRHLMIAAAAVLVLAVAFFAGYLPRRLARKKLAAGTPTAAVAPRVSVVKAVLVDPARQLQLPAALVADQQTLVYARANGYVSRWLVDIGDRVKKGQLLVQLDTPELDKQLTQAKASLSQTMAALAQAQANRDYAYITSKREAQLFAKSLISAQENDQALTQARVWDANVNAAKATVAAQRANVGQLESTDPMQAYVDVPQVYAPSVRVGAEAKVAVRNFRGRVFTGRITRTAGALDPASRTLRTEVDLPNPKGELLAGMYVDVSLDVAVTHQVIRVPSSAIIADARGVHVAVVDGSGKVKLVAVTTGLDNGNTIELVTGLSGGEQVISAPPSDVADGMQVQAVTAG